MMNDESDAKKLVTEFLAVFSTGDVDGVLARLSEDGTWWVSGTIPGVSGTYGRAALGELLRSVKPIYKAGALEITPSRMIAEGESVAVEAECHGELQNGGIYNNRYHFLFRVRDGKISQVKEYMDTKHVYETFVEGM